MMKAGSGLPKTKKETHGICNRVKLMNGKWIGICDCGGCKNCTDKHCSRAKTKQPRKAVYVDSWANGVYTRKKTKQPRLTPAKKLTARVEYLEKCLLTLCFWLVQQGIFGDHDFKYFQDIVYDRVIEKAANKKVRK